MAESYGKEILEIIAQNARMMANMENMTAAFGDLKSDLKTIREMQQQHEKDHEIFALKKDVDILQSRVKALEDAPAKQAKGFIDLLKEKFVHIFFGLVFTGISVWAINLLV